jgi:protein-L-isoaspartate(D-aspartate) O-methyltransferase
MAAMARENLARNAIFNATVREVAPEAAASGHLSGGPFDAIVLSGSVAEVPRALLAQLAPGGRLVAIVGEEPVMRARLITRVGEAAFADTDLFDTVAPRLLGFPEKSRFSF